MEEEAERDGRGGGVAAEEREQVGGGGGGGHGRVPAGGVGAAEMGLNRPGLAARWAARSGQRPGPLRLRGGAWRAVDLLTLIFHHFYKIPRLVFTTEYHSSSFCSCA